MGSKTIGNIYSCSENHIRSLYHISTNISFWNLNWDLKTHEYLKKKTSLDIFDILKYHDHIGNSDINTEIFLTLFFSQFPANEWVKTKFPWISTFLLYKKTHERLNQITLIYQFLVIVSILYTRKKTGGYGGYKMETLARNVLIL